MLFAYKEAAGRSRVTRDGQVTKRLDSRDAFVRYGRVILAYSRWASLVPT